MQRRTRDGVLLCISIGSFFLTSLCFLVMPLEMPDLNPKVLGTMISTVFWLSALLGIALQFVLARRRSAWLDKNTWRQNRSFLQAKFGLTAFFQNPLARIIDILCALSLVFLILAVVLTNSTGYVCYIALALFVFTFCLHCILNGKIFYYVQNQNIIFREKTTVERKGE